MKQKLFSFLADETGQSTTEYILMLAVVVAVAMKFKTEFQSRLSGIVTKLGGDIESATGNASQ